MLSLCCFQSRTNSHIFCQIETFLVIFGYAGSISWACCFAHALFVSIRRSQIEKIGKVRQILCDVLDFCGFWDSDNSDYY